MSEVKWLIEFGKKIDEILEYSCSTEEDLAIMMGVSQSTISKYRTGQQMPSIKNILKIVYIFGWDVDDLVDFGEDVH